jgi:hypothetical protein
MTQIHQRALGLCWKIMTLIGINELHFIQSFHWHVQNATIPCHSQELLPFLSATHFFLPPFSTNHSSILSHFILPSISWSTFQSCCSQIHILEILLPSTLCTYPNQHIQFYFLPLSVHTQTNVIYLTILSLL